MRRAPLQKKEARQADGREKKIPERDGEATSNNKSEMGKNRENEKERKEKNEIGSVRTTRVILWEANS